MRTNSDINKLVLFDHAVELDVPLAFPDPFHPIPHPLAVKAAEQLQQYLDSPSFKGSCPHNFLKIGKMFGVLVVLNDQGELGFLAGFSGKLNDSNHIDPFVPPIYDVLVDQGIYKTGETAIHELTLAIENLEQDENYHRLNIELQEHLSFAKQRIKSIKQQIKANKQARASARNQINSFDNDASQQLEQLRLASVNENLFLKHEKKRLEEVQQNIEKQLEIKQREIETKKVLRRSMSTDLQHKLFDHYFLLSAAGETSSLRSVFLNNKVETPPAGAGECAGPKLLDFAYKHQLKPIALAEFWWGNPPPSEVRIHGNFYPSCNSKCKPILGFMLEGLHRSPSFTEVLSFENKRLEVIHEDDAIVVVHKPADFLSVPGKEIYDSVYARVLERYPEISGPIIIHRLDMATSGLMLIAKHKKAHHFLQQQFIKHTIQKRYCALLDGELAEKKGEIHLPLRVDLDDRPRQLVCYDYGKPAHTSFEVMEIINGRTRIKFYPHTGRTHQLRMHAAHPNGLNLPIVGDDLYGTPADRLYLHAEFIRFQHPTTREFVEFYVKPEF